jgi:hypothetical protein
MNGSSVTGCRRRGSSVTTGVVMSDAETRAGRGGDRPAGAAPGAAQRTQQGRFAPATRPGRALDSRAAQAILGHRGRQQGGELTGHVELLGGRARPHGQGCPRHCRRTGFRAAFGTASGRTRGSERRCTGARQTRARVQAKLTRRPRRGIALLGRPGGGALRRKRERLEWSAMNPTRTQPPGAR